MLKFLCQENELFIKSWMTAVFLLFLQFLFSYRCALTHTHTQVFPTGMSAWKSRRQIIPRHMASPYRVAFLAPCDWSFFSDTFVGSYFPWVHRRNKDRWTRDVNRVQPSSVEKQTPSLLHSSSSASMICCCYDCDVSVLASCVFLLAWLILFMMEELIKEESTFPPMTTQNVCRDLAIEEIIAGWRCLLPARFYWYWTNNFLVWLLCE